MRKTYGVILALGLSATAAYAGWQDQASRYDVGRLARLEESRAKGLAEAERGAPQADLEIIHSILGAGGEPASPGALIGMWRCRTMLLGGMTPDRIYSWFLCRISDHGGRLFFEKLSGSQRMAGWLYPEGGAYVYLGASSVTGEKPHAYSGNGAEAGSVATPDDQIGALSLTTDGRARLELPYPVQESIFDVIELKR